MISIIETKLGYYEVRFPYDQTLVEYVKCAPGRRWHPKEKMWTVPDDKIGFFLNMIKDTSFEDQLDPTALKMIQSSPVPVNTTQITQIPDMDVSELPTWVVNGGKLFKHQTDCIKYSLGRKYKGNYSGFLLADEQGLGKTLEIINLALLKKQYENCKHCLVLCCINSTKYNWQSDIEKHTNGEYQGYLIGSRIKRDGTIRQGSGGEKLKDLETGFMYGDEERKEPLPYFLILNVESLRHIDKNARRRDEKYDIANQIIYLINHGEISMIALDEVHRNTSPQSVQGKCILRIKKYTGGKAEWIPMTGTPIVNKPTDVFLPMRLVNAHTNNSYYSWNRKYCIFGGFGGHAIIGYKNIRDMKSILEPNMLRRRKEDVLDLPPKVHHVEYVENTKIQQRLYLEVKNDILMHKELIVKALNPMSKLLKLRQVNGCPELIDSSINPKSKDYIRQNAKISRLLELVQDINEYGEKVVIFSNWLEPLRTAFRCLKREGYNVCTYTGTMSDEEREHNKSVFIKDPSCTAILGTIGALGTSHTLSVANNVIFLDMPWNAATLDQAEDRCYRIGTSETVNIYFIITKDTVDERVYDIIERKRGTSNYIVDDDLDVRNHPEILDMLLS